MKKLIITSLFLLAFIGLKAQDLFFSLYYQNPVWLNAGAAGAEDKHVFSLTGRDQWDIYKSAMLTYDQPIKKINSGIGAVVMYDRSGSGNLTTYYAGLNYNYKIKLAEKMHLAIGAQGAFVRRTIDVSNLFFANQFTGSGFSANTDVGLNTAENYIDIDAGVWYSWSDFYVGIDVKHLITTPTGSFLETAPDRIYQNIIFTGGYTWKFSKHFSMIPSAVLMVQGPSTLFEIDDEFSLNDTYFLGAGFRPTDDVNALKVCGGIKFKKKIQLMLAYDFKGPGSDVPSSVGWYGLEANIKYWFK